MSSWSLSRVREILNRPNQLTKRKLQQRFFRQRYLQTSIEGLEPRLMLARDLLIADAVSDSILRFDGTTGAALGAFVSSGSGGLVDPLDPEFGPDGNLYVISNNPGNVKVLRYNGISGAFLGTFVDTGVGGFNSGSAIEFGPDGNLYVASISEKGVLRFSGGTGAFLGIAASENGIRRASGIDFGPDGNLYVLDSDRTIETSADRILRFNPATGAFIDQFVAPGRLNDAVFLTFGPDNDIFVPDIQQFKDVRRFSGASGDFLGVYVRSPSPPQSPIFDIQFGPDGNAYASTGDRILRYDGETGSFINEFVEGIGGSITFFPPNGAAADLDVSNLQIPAGVVHGSDLSVKYTVTNTSSKPTDVTAWVDVVYLSKDNVFDPSDREIKRIARSTGLAPGASYTETLTATLSDVSPDEYHVFVFADRRGLVNDANRLNNVESSVQTLEVFPPLAASHDPDQSIIVGRTLSAYTTADVVNSALTITYTVYNETNGYVQGTLLTTTLGPQVTFISASQLPDRSGQNLAWSLGTLAPFGRASVTVNVTLANSTTQQIDSGAKSFAMLDTVVVSDRAPAAILRTGAIAANLLASTPDANTTDPFIQAKAATLDYDAQAIFKYLNNDVGYESYTGSLRGARGTLWSAAGNSLDEASLGVALYRASGIPARYAHGTLSDPLAKQMILSMFPASFQNVGYIPPGTNVADPANDAKLLIETRDHYWVQFDSGNGFQHADSSGLSGASIGTTFTSVSDTFTEIVDSLRNKVRVWLDAEIYNSASALFGFTDGRSTTTVLDRTFNSVDLVGRPLTVGNFVSTNNLGGLVFSSQTTTYTSYLILGDDAYPSELQNQLESGSNFQELFTNFPFGSQILTGLFLNIAVTDLNLSTQTYTHTMFDRIGVAARQNGQQSAVTFDPSAGPSLTPLDTVTIGINAAPRRSVQNTFFVADPAEDAVQRFDDIAKEYANASPSEQTSILNRAITEFNVLLVGIARTQIAAFELRAARLEAILARSLKVAAYPDGPRITIASTALRSEVSSAGALSFRMNLLRSIDRVQVGSGQSTRAAIAYNIDRGILENEIEGEVLPQPGATSSGSFSVGITTALIFRKAAEQGVTLITLRPGHESVIATLPYSADVLTRIQNALSSGYTVVIPVQPIVVEGQSSVGWYQIDEATGDTIGVLGDGSHGAIAEWALVQQNASSNSDSPTARFMFGVLAGAFAGNTKLLIFTFFLQVVAKAIDDPNLNDFLALKQYFLTLFKQLDELEGLLSKSDPVFYAGYILGAAVMNQYTADPPLPTAAIDVRPFSNSNVVSRELSASAVLVPGTSIQGTSNVASLAYSGNVTLKWNSDSTASFNIESLAIGLGQVSNASGNVIGTGQVSVSTSAATDIILAGTANISVQGKGDVSFYGPAEDNLGVSADWENYSATVTGNLSVTLRVPDGVLAINGNTLPSGFYTITTNSAKLLGSGNTSSPSFAGSATLTAASGTVNVGPASGSINVGGNALAITSGATLAGYTGTLTIAAGGGDADNLIISGNAAQVLTLSTTPTTISADQNTPDTFRVNVNTSFTDTYTIIAEAPTGWTVAIDDIGNVTVTPAAGTQSGIFPMRVIAQSNGNPHLLAQATVNVLVTPTLPGITFQVDPDPVFTVPYNGALVPAAFRASIKNLGPAADTVALTFANLPSAFDVINSGTSLTIPAGQTGLSGLYLRPNGGPLPIPGTVISFEVTATSISNPGITQTRTVTFTVPEIRALTVNSTPTAIATLPELATNVSLDLQSVGNVAENAQLTLTVSNGLTVTGLPATTSLSRGQKLSIPLTVIVASTVPLNSNLSISILVKFGANPDTEQTTLVIPIRVVVPGADAIASAANSATELGNTTLANRLGDLSTALTNLVQNPDSAIFKSQSIVSIDSILSLLAVDPILVSFSAPLIASRQALDVATTPTAIQAAVQSVGAALDDFATVTAVLADSNFELFLLPNSQISQPLVPREFQLRIHNIGARVAPTTYNLTLTGLPPGVSGSLAVNSVTLARDEFATVAVTITSNSLTELSAFEFELNVAVDGFPNVAKSIVGGLAVRKEFISVVAVTATPPFTVAGGSVEVSARVLNAVNREQRAQASFVVRDSNGQQVGARSTPVDLTLTVQTSLVTVPLGSITTTGLARGNYSIVLTLTDTSGAPIPGATGLGSFLVGSPLTASIEASPSVLPPGTSTVTNTLKIEALAPLVSPPKLLGQAAVAGSNDVVRNGDFVYVAGSAGISVFNIAGANRENPQLVRVVGTATSLLEMRGNLLVSVLSRGGGGSTKLDTFSLADPANPTFQGTTGDIPYGTAADLIVTDSHAFIVLVNLVFTLQRDIIDQNGGLIAINVSNPAAPFFDGDAVSARGTPAGRDGVNDGVLFNDNGTNNDGIKSPLGIDQSGGNQNTWSVVQASPTILLLSGSTATGTNTQAGVGVVRVVDISNPRNMRLLRDLQIPGTVHVFDVAVSGSRALITASQGGLADFTNGFPFTGNVVLATLNLSDPANPNILHQQTLERAARGVDHARALGSGFFAISNLGATTDQPGLFIVDANDPDQLGIAGIDVPAGINELIGSEGLIFTTDGASLIVYEVPPIEPLTLVGHVPISGGLRGVAARNNIAYTSGTNGIQIINYSNLAAPSVVGTIPGNHYAAVIQDNVLLALRPSGPSFILDVYALQNTPLNPPLIGSSPVINYNLAVELRANSTHAFVGQLNVCSFLGSNDIYHHAGDLISLALNLDSAVNPTAAAPALENVLFNTNGDNTFDPTDVSGCAENGGDHNVLGIALPNPQTAYLATTTVTGGNSQAGVGRVQVVDVTTPTTARVIRDLDIPGTVISLGVGVSGNVGVVIGSTQGFQDNPSGVIIGKLTVTTLDVTDPLNPRIVTSRVLDIPTSTFWVNFTSLGNGRFAFANQGFVGNTVNPKVIVIDASNPRSPLIGQMDIPIDLIAPNSLSTDGTSVFTADSSGVSIYRVNPLPGLPVTARVQIPKGTSVTVVPGSFNIPPSETIVGASFDTYVFDLTLAPSLSSETLNWQSVVTGLKPGESRQVTLGTLVDFAFQGTTGRIDLPGTSVIAEQVLSLLPGIKSVRPGEEAAYSVTLANPSALPVTYDLSVGGVLSEWVNIDSQVTVPARGTAVASLRLKSDPFAVVGDYGFVVNASVAGVTSSVSGTLKLTGTPSLPDVQPESQGLVVSLTPSVATVGQGTTASYVTRVYNTGSSPDDYKLSVTGLPAGFQVTFGANDFRVPPGASNFREVPLSIMVPVGTLATDYAFKVVASSNTVVTITDQVDARLTVLQLGVRIQMTPQTNGPNSVFQMQVTNTGQARETFDLALAAPVALVAMLGTTSVTLQPGQSQSVPINVGAVDFALSGALTLVGVARSRTNSAVFSSDEVDVTIAETSGLTTAFDLQTIQLAAPGSTSFRLQVNNIGNLEDEYTATILSTSGPINASLVGLQGETTRTIPVFILPGLSSGALLLNASLLNSGLATVTVRVTSRSKPTQVADATATLLTESSTTLSVAGISADKAEGNSGVTPFIFTVTRAGNVSGTTSVNYALSGSGLIPADATDFDGSNFPSGQISFASNETSKTITINVRGDSTNEPDERFTVTLSGASGGATIANGFASGVIRNDDANSGFRLNCSSLRVGLNTCEILGATPVGVVNLALGIVPGTKFLERFRVTVGMLDSKVVAQGIVQPDGRAVVQFNIASEQLLQQVLLQAFEHAPTPRTTNIVIVGLPLLALNGQSTSTEKISSKDLGSLLTAAIARWKATGLAYLENQVLDSVSADIIDLPSGMLGRAVDQHIFIDESAAGNRWFVDHSPENDSEFSVQVGATERKASVTSPAFNRVDLLSVLMHELGHVLGKADVADTTTHTVMAAALPVGTRRHFEPNTPAVSVPQDTNRDGVVSPLDALLIINHLNQRVRQSALFTRSEYDINKDGFVSPIDALLVINYLNRSYQNSNGEGESGSPENAHIQTESSVNQWCDDDLLSSLASDVVASGNHIRRKTAPNSFRMR